MSISIFGFNSSHVKFGFKALGYILSGQPKSCPYCDSKNATVMGREKLLIQLRECSECGLRFRYPKDEPEAAREYYEQSYEGGHVTDLPDSATLEAARSNNFVDSRWDFADKIEATKAIHGGPRLLEFGCSWGYVVDQFNKAGFDATGFELSRPRADFGRQNLGVKILDEYGQLEALPDDSFDVIFTNHVLEHLPDLRPAFALFSRLLSPNGALVIIVPNGDGPTARTQGAGVISQEHVTSLTARFFSQNMNTYGFSPKFASEPYTGTLIDYVSDEQAFENLQGEELMAVVRKSE
tara:strand:- start:11328 stop:12212 length:885 start_codon:yes stop_codon:yes gene_type:complete